MVGAMAWFDGNLALCTFDLLAMSVTSKDVAEIFDKKPQLEDYKLGGYTACGIPIAWSANKNGS